MTGLEHLLAKTPEQGPFVTQYFDGRTFVGERKRFCFTTEWHSRTYSCHYPHEAYFCPECGEIWGRAIHQLPPGYRPIPRAKWTMYTRACPKHGDGFFLELLPFEDLATCSLELLKREVELLFFHERKA